MAKKPARTAKERSPAGKGDPAGPKTTRPEARSRREKALELAADINQAQGIARRFGTRGQGDYKPFDQLTNLSSVPEGFRVQLHTDGMTYSFSIKDTRDPCGYAIFSDQSLDIYEAVPSPMRTRSRLLTQN